MYNKNWTLSKETGKILFHISSELYKSYNYKLPTFYNHQDLPPADTIWPEQYQPTDVFIRQFENVTVFPNRVITKGNEILKESFLKHPNHAHGGVIRQTDGSYKLRRRLENPLTKHISEAIYIDTPYPKVFGHVLLEVMTLFWVKQFMPPELKIITSVDIDKYHKWFAIYGLDKKDFFRIDSPINVDKIYIPSPTVVLRKFIHPLSLNYMRSVLPKESLASFTSNYGDKIYISRSNIPDRRLINENEVEDLFRQYGFKIFYPEKHSPDEQIDIFRNAKLIAGTAGSGMHNLIFSRKDAKVLLLSSLGWIVVADLFVTSFMENRLGYVIGTPINFDGNFARTQADWEINISDVKKAIEQHFFGLN